MADGNSVSDVFKHAMHSWVDLMEKKAAVNQDMKVINSKLKDLKAFLVDVMARNKFDGVNCNGHRVNLTTTRTKETLTRETMIRLMSEFSKEDPKGLAQMADYVLNNRKVKESHGLRMVAIPGYALSVRENSAAKGDGGDTASSASIAVGLRKIRELERADALPHDTSQFSDGGSCNSE